MRFAMAVVLLRSVRADPVRAGAVLLCGAVALAGAVMPDLVLAPLVTAFEFGGAGVTGGVGISITATCCDAREAWPRWSG
jgi:hypothetical protein